MKTIVVNGANGYVAANFINKLLFGGYKVVALVRGSKKTAEERMKEALLVMNGYQPLNLAHLEVFDYSLLDEGFLLPKECLQKIFKGQVDYFHFAASLKYDLKSKDEIFETNIQGLENSLKTYLDYATSNSRFFFISTAYSCGNFKGIFEERFYDNEDISSFRNYYEQSKRFAENIIKKYIQEKDIDASIVRLSQVVGDSSSGVTKTDYGIFDFIKRVYSLSKRYPGQQIRVDIDPDASQNLIPIDVVVDGLTNIIKKDSVPRVINFVAKNPIKNSFIIKSINGLLPISLMPTKRFGHNGLSPIERVVAAGMSFSKSYTNTNLLFETQKRDQVVCLEKEPPDELMIYKMIKYFLINLAIQKNPIDVDAHKLKNCLL